VDVTLRVPDVCRLVASDRPTVRPCSIAKINYYRGKKKKKKKNLCQIPSEDHGLSGHSQGRVGSDRTMMTCQSSKCEEVAVSDMATRSVLLSLAVCSLGADAASLAGVQPALRFRGGATPAAVVSQPAPNKLRGGKLSMDMQLPTEAKLILGSAGIFLSFSVFAVLQEDVYKKAYGGEFFAFTFFALLVERGINALTAFAGVSSLGKSGLLIPYKDIFNSGVSQMLAMAASNEALRYVSYPTQARRRQPLPCVVAGRCLRPPCSPLRSLASRARWCRSWPAASCSEARSTRRSSTCRWRRLPSACASSTLAAARRRSERRTAHGG
jgi:hypothetical protein